MPSLGDIETFGPTEDADVEAPTGLIRGPDDRIWFTSIGNDRLGRLDPSSGRIEIFADAHGAVHLPANPPHMRDSR